MGKAVSIEMKKKILVVLVMFAVLFGINQTYSVAIAQEKDKHIIVEIGSQKFDAVLTNEEAANEFQMGWRMQSDKGK